MDDSPGHEARWGDTHVDDEIMASTTVGTSFGRYTSTDLGFLFGVLYVIGAEYCSSHRKG
jgi:hypothetical protein